MSLEEFILTIIMYNPVLKERPVKDIQQALLRIADKIKAGQEKEKKWGKVK